MPNRTAHGRTRVARLPAFEYGRAANPQALHNATMRMRKAGMPLRRMQARPCPGGIALKSLQCFSPDQ